VVGSIFSMPDTAARENIDLNRRLYKE